jgi:hypothetical protein
MTLSEFRSLNKEKRYVLRLAKEEETAFYENDGSYYVLYQLDGSYVDIRINKFCPEITRMVAFSGGDRLEPYLQQIDIS